MCRKDLELRIQQLNKRLGYTWTCRQRADGKGAEFFPGAFHLDRMQPGDATRVYKLVRYANEGGGEREVTRTRCNARELALVLDGIETGLELARDRRVANHGV